MSYPKAIKELPEVWRMVYSLKDPMEFINMLAANCYFAGQFGNKMPVSEIRTIFLIWLSNYDPIKKKG